MKKMILTLLAAAPAWATAACTLTFTPAILHSGTQPSVGLPMAEVGGYRRVMQTTGVLTGLCDEERSQVRLAFSQLMTAGAGLVRWQHASLTAGALRLRITDARVGITQVPIVIESSGQASTLGPIDIADNSTLALDLTQVPVGNGRRNFTLNFSVLAMLAHGYVPNDLTIFSTTPRVELLP